MRFTRSSALRVLAPLVFLALGVDLACGSAASTDVGSGQGGGPIFTNADGGNGGHLNTTTIATTTSSTTKPGSDGPGGPYPFVLAHGFFGFQNFAGLSFETYFYGVKDYLATQGEIVDTPAVDPFNDSDTRGAQLLTAVEQFVAQTGAKKVNIIGHSQGGLDARVVANLRPDLVASVVTISTPHHGSPVGDVAMKFLSDPNFASIVDALVKLIGAPIYDTIGNSTSVTKSLYLFSQPGITAFNQNHPNSPGVFYASFGGRSEGHGNDSDCTGEAPLPFITSWYGDTDPLNSLFWAFTPILDGAPNFYTHDGLVRARDAKWGHWWGCVPGDHIDEIGQILGQSPGAGNNWKYMDFYVQLIAYMRSLGY